MAPKPLTETWTKAQLKFLAPDPGGGEKEVDKALEFDFNPKEYSITRSADWSVPAAKSGVAQAQYNGPKPSSITVELFMDATEEDKGDISTTVDKLLKACNPTQETTSKNKPSAPFVLFQWGKKISFKGYIEQVAVKYTLFRPDGTPVRGSATLTLKEFGEPVKGTNPTSGGEPGTTRHRVLAGDTLPSIAYAEFGRADAWRTIADANPQIHDPMRLRPGTVLIIPPA
jgi:nucleoid-associated protein YgaU